MDSPSPLLLLYSSSSRRRIGTRASLCRIQEFAFLAMLNYTPPQAMCVEQEVRAILSRTCQPLRVYHHLPLHPCSQKSVNGVTSMALQGLPLLLLVYPREVTTQCALLVAPNAALDSFTEASNLSSVTLVAVESRSIIIRTSSITAALTLASDVLSVT